MDNPSTGAYAAHLPAARLIAGAGAAQILGNVSLGSRASRSQPVSAPAPVEELLQEVTDAGCLSAESDRGSPILVNEDAACAAAANCLHHTDCMNHSSDNC